MCVGTAVSIIYRRESIWVFYWWKIAYFNLSIKLQRANGNTRSTIKSALVSGQTEGVWDKAKGKNLMRLKTLLFRSSAANPRSVPVMFLTVKGGSKLGRNVCFRPGWKKLSWQLWIDGPLSRIKAWLSHNGSRMHTNPAILGKYVSDIKYGVGYVKMNIIKSEMKG